MEISIFLAKAWGALLVIISLAFLINSKGLSHLFGYMKDEGRMFVAGWITLILGVLSVVAHNIWQGETWVVVVTVLGWLTLIKGVIRTVFPYWVVKLVGYFEKRKDWLKFFLVVGLVVGAYLLLVAK